MFQRKHQRVRVDARIKVHDILEDKTQYAQIVDLSAGGVALTVETRILQSTPVALTFWLPDGMVCRNLPGDVVWVKASKGGHDIGICFHDLTPEEISLLDGFVMKHWNRQERKLFKGRA